MLATVGERASDLVARIGGEEFALLLAATDCDGACRVAEQARSALWDLDIEHADTDLRRVTASFGVACAMPSERTTPDALLALADAALYVAKRSGRNRVATDADAPEQGA